MFSVVSALLFRYIHLLSKYRPEQPDATPLSSTFALLCAKNPAADSVVALIMDIVDSLLSSEDMETPSDAAPILVECVASEAVDSGTFVIHSCFIHMYFKCYCLRHLPAVHCIYSTKTFKEPATTGVDANW
jgi:hypothetical protein